jgi:flagellin
MGLRIGTNTQSLAAQRALGISETAQRATLEKLASGKRINHAADDAAGLAISEKMRAAGRSLKQDIRNAQDGISVLQTAEGGMNEISNILVRFRELSIQAASDTIGNTERSFINKEVDQLSQEVDRITQATEFNGKLKLLDGQGGILEIQVGLNNKPDEDRFRLDQSQTDVRLGTLGLTGINVLGKEAAQENIGRVDNAMQMINERRANLGALQNRLQSSINSLMVYDENLSAARSRIVDTDMAAETSESTKQNLLAQAGVSVLAQANQNPQLALKLLS